MGRLAVNVLGGFQASLDSGAPCTLPTKKAQALLAYLALAPGRVCPRPALASLLWGERGDAQALKSLRQTVYTLRRAVEKVDPSVLRLEGGIAANPAALDVDAVRFERLVKEGTPLALERAAALYRGDLLQGFTLDEAAFEEWLVAERERLRELAIDVLARLLAHQAVTSATEAGIQTAVRLLALDPLQEHAHRTLMRLYARQGRRSAALRQYQVCVNLMRRELRTEPDTETKELYLELLQDRRGARGEQEPMSASSEPRVTAPVTRERLELAFPEGPLIGRERADGEIPFHLAGELAGLSSGSVADDEEVVGFPPEALSLETDLSDHAVDKDGRNAAHEELRQPVGADVLFEGRARAAGRRGAGDAWTRTVEPGPGAALCSISAGIAGPHRVLVMSTLLPQPPTNRGI